MRVSIAFVSIEEMRMFTVSVRDILVYVNRLMELPKPSQGESSRIEITYQLSDPHDRSNNTYEGEARFFNGEEEVVFNPSWTFGTSFTPPKGCNLNDCFQWLTAEASTMAFAMSNGRVEVEDIDDLPEVNADGKYRIILINSDK